MNHESSARCAARIDAAGRFPSVFGQQSYTPIKAIFSQENIRQNAKTIRLHIYRSCAPIFQRYGLCCSFGLYASFWGPVAQLSLRILLSTNASFQQINKI